MSTPTSQRGGFTLLELLMVVIIIAILASIALPQYLRVSERARGAEALTVLKAIQGAELRFKAEAPNGVYQNVLGTVLTSGLDIEGPGFGFPLSKLWTYTVNGTGGNSNANATRIGFATKIISLDLDTGQTCAPTWGNTYGLSNGNC